MRYRVYFTRTATIAHTNVQDSHRGRRQPDRRYDSRRVARSSSNVVAVAASARSAARFGVEASDDRIAPLVRIVDVEQSIFQHSEDGTRPTKAPVPSYPSQRGR